MLYISKSQLEMFKALNATLKTNQQYLDSQQPDNWEYSPDWKELIGAIKGYQVQQQHLQHISSLIQL